MSTAYVGLEPEAVWQHFAALNAIPRESKNEAAARQYVAAVAQREDLAWAADSKGNCVVRIPNRCSNPDAPVVVLQSHLDMVIAVEPGRAFNAARDPIVPKRVGDAIYAAGTTLGADNGLGAALALAFATTPDLEHGPLELLFTVEEEIGLLGASALDPDLISGRCLINLDLEELGTICVGCAGGRTSQMHVPVQRSAAPFSGGLSLEITGLRGGHSGIEIGSRRANAVHLLAECLQTLIQSGIPVRVSSVWSGTAGNKIPSEATALLCVDPASAERIAAAASEWTREQRAVWGDDEPELQVAIRAADPPPDVWDTQDTNRVLALLLTTPTGVHTMSSKYPGKVQTSQNAAMLRTERDAVTLLVSIRSFLDADLDTCEAVLSDIAQAAGGTCQAISGYPAWPPEGQSDLLDACQRAHMDVLGAAAAVDIIHAGVECGVIASRVPGLSAISIGPTMHDVHTPKEHVDIPAVAQFWSVLTQTLRQCAYV